jgi:hypothetical protein
MATCAGGVGWKRLGHRREGDDGGPPPRLPLLRRTGEWRLCASTTDGVGGLRSPRAKLPRGNSNPGESGFTQLQQSTLCIQTYYNTLFSYSPIVMCYDINFFPIQ